MLIKVLLIFLIVFFILLGIGIYDANRFVVVNQKFELKGLKKPCRFVMLSDLHNKEYGNHNDVVLVEIKKAKPDFILFPGDLITSHVNESVEPGVRFAKELAKDYKVYFSNGNHETKLDVARDYFGNMYDELMKRLEDCGVVVLNDMQLELPEYGINLIGLNMERKYFARFKKVPLCQNYMVNKVGEPKEEYCNVLMAHNPNYFEDYADWGADFVLSGHMHGGIMKLPLIGGVISPAYTLFPKYDGGIFHYGKSTMLLGRGMGAHTLPFRFFNPAELHIVDIMPINSLHN